MRQQRRRSASIAAAALQWSSCTPQEQPPASGQTGSLVYDTPEIEKPGQQPDEGAPSRLPYHPEIVPQRPARLAAAAIVDSKLLLTSREGLSRFDVTTPQNPISEGKLALLGARFLAAESLERIVLAEGKNSTKASCLEAQPTRPIRVVEVDASGPGDPVLVASGPWLDSPTDEVVITRSGYTLLGAEIEPENRCPSLNEKTGLWPILSLSARHFERQGSEFVEIEGRDFAPGQWLVTSDSAYAVRVNPPASVIDRPVELEVVDLQTLLERTFSWDELGQPNTLSFLLRVAHRQGVLLLATRSGLLGF